MKVEKVTVYRIIARIVCGCTAQREYKDEICSEPLYKPTFTPCTTHKGKGEAVSMAELLLTERVEEEAEKTVEVAKAAKIAAVQTAAISESPAPASEETITQEGGVVTRIPIRQPQQRPATRPPVSIRPAGTPSTIDANKAAAIRTTQIQTGQRPAPPATPGPVPARPASTNPVPARPAQPGQPARTGPVKTYQRPAAPVQSAPKPVVAAGPRTSDVNEQADRLEQAQKTNLLDAFLEDANEDE